MTRTRTATAIGASLWLWCAAAWWQRAAAAEGGPASLQAEREALTAALGAGALEAQARACQRLAVIGTAEAVPALAGLLGDARLAAYARQALEAIPGPEAGEALCAALETLRGSLLAGAIRSLGVRREPRAVPALARRLDDGDEAVAEAAAAALGRIAAPEAGQVLGAALGTAAPPRREAIAHACLECAEQWLQRGRGDAAADLCERVRRADLPARTRAAATRGLVLARGEAAAALLAETLRSEEPAFRALGLSLLRELPAGTVAAPGFSAAAADLPESLQVLVVQALADRSDAAGLALVRRAAASPGASVRVAALRALGRMGDASCAGLLIEGLAAGRSPEEVEAAAGSLRRVRGPEADAALAAALPASPAAVRVRLMDVLAQRGARGAAGALFEQAADADPAVSAAAFSALGAVATPADLPRLARLLLGCPHDAARDAAVRAVAAAAQREPDPSRRADALTALWPEARDSRGRCLLVRALGAVANYAAFAVLREALAAEDAEVRDAALRAFAGWPDATPTPVLLDVAARAEAPAPRTLALRAALRLAGMAAADCETPSRQVLDWFARAASAARTPDDRKLLLAGLAGLRHPAALDLALPCLDDAAVQAEAGEAILQIAAALPAMGQREAAKRALAQVAARAGDPALRDRARAAAESLEAPLEYVLEWQICGPYTEPGKECQQLYAVPFGPEQAGGAAEWRLLPPGNIREGRLVQVGAVLPGNHCVAYARTWLVSPREQPARLEFGFDDGGKVWLDGSVVCEANTAGACVPGAHGADVTLREGANLLFLKLTQHSGPWQFCVRVAGADGQPLPGVQVSAVPAGEAAPAAPAVPPAEPVDTRALDEAAPEPLFDGRTFAGWEGDTTCFRIEEGAIVGGQLAQPIPRSAYLCTTRAVGDFDLTALVRTRGNATNGGLQFWGARIPGSHEMTGLQADLCDGAYWGCLYDGTRGRLLVTVPQRELAHIVRQGDWNTYRIRAAGGRIQLWLNGYQTVDWVETDPAIARQGVFGLQTHQGPPGEVWYRDLQLRTAQ